MTVIRQDEQSLSASPAVAGSASRPAIYNSKADKWRESGPLISVNWMWHHFFTAVRYDALPEDIRGGRCIGIFNVLIRGRVDDRSCHASTCLSRRAGEGASEVLKSFFVWLSEEKTNTLTASRFVLLSDTHVEMWRLLHSGFPDRRGNTTGDWNEFSSALLQMFDWQASKVPILVWKNALVKVQLV